MLYSACNLLKKYQFTKGQLISKGLFGVFKPTKKEQRFFLKVESNKNECEIHSKVIVSQDYFDY